MKFLGLFNLFKNKEEDKKEDKLLPVNFLRKLIDKDSRFNNIECFEDCYENAKVGFMGSQIQPDVNIVNIMRNTSKYHMMEDYVPKPEYTDALHNLLNIYNKCLVSNLNYYSGMFPNGELMVDSTKCENVTNEFTSAELIFAIVLLNFMCEKMSGYKNSNFNARDLFTKKKEMEVTFETFMEMIFRGSNKFNKLGDFDKIYKEEKRRLYSTTYDKLDEYGRPESSSYNEERYNWKFSDKMIELIITLIREYNKIDGAVPVREYDLDLQTIKDYLNDKSLSNYFFVIVFIRYCDLILPNFDCNKINIESLCTTIGYSSEYGIQTLKEGLSFIYQNNNEILNEINKCSTMNDIKSLCVKLKFNQEIFKENFDKYTELQYFIDLGMFEYIGLRDTSRLGIKLPVDIRKIDSIEVQLDTFISVYIAYKSHHEDLKNRITDDGGILKICGLIFGFEKYKNNASSINRVNLN